MTEKATWNQWGLFGANIIIIKFSVSEIVIFMQDFFRPFAERFTFLLFPPPFQNASYIVKN